MPFDIPAPIVRHEPLNPDHFLITLESRAIARAARAGQFVMLQTRDGSDPLLRRPMSICRVLPGRRGLFQVLYKVVGEGTLYLSRQPAGARLMTLGPLGNGFRLPPARRRAPARRPVLVAGGIGVAIFPFLAGALAARGLEPLLLFGARTRRDLVGRDLFRAFRMPVRVATEDGSAGCKGYVTRLLEPLLSGPRRAVEPELFVCGPTPMMRAVGAMAREAGVPCQLALESQMPCGIGVCLGCVVACREAGAEVVYRRVCTEGPVFEAASVLP